MQYKMEVGVADGAATGLVLQNDPIHLMSLWIRLCINVQQIVLNKNE